MSVPIIFLWHTLFRCTGGNHEFYINETDLRYLVIEIRHGVQSCAHFNYHSQRRGIYSHANCVRRQY